jgi:hypothetical protein
MYHPLAFAIAFTHIAAAIALLNGILTTIGQGNVAAHAVEAIARQPEAKGSINHHHVYWLWLCRDFRRIRVRYLYPFDFRSPAYRQQS